MKPARMFRIVTNGLTFRVQATRRRRWLWFVWLEPWQDLGGPDPKVPFKWSPSDYDSLPKAKRALDRIRARDAVREKPFTPVTAR